MKTVFTNTAVTSAMT